MDRLVPDVVLARDERELARFEPDRATYLRANATLAAAAMAAGMAILWALDNPHVWTGAIGGLAAVAVRAVYLRSDEMAVRWVLTSRRLLGPQGRAVPLDRIALVRTLAGMVQIVTQDGDKHLIKYQADPARVLAEIERAR